MINVDAVPPENSLASDRSRPLPNPQPFRAIYSRIAAITSL